MAKLAKRTKASEKNPKLHKGTNLQPTTNHHPAFKGSTIKPRTRKRNSFQRKKEGKRRSKPELPALDDSGRVHGDLPKAKDLGRYSKEELEILHEDLVKSVPARIQNNITEGYDQGHALRQRKEQDLIQSIEKHLKNRK